MRRFIIKELRGRLLFIGWERPWNLVMETGEKIDLQPIIANVLALLNDRQVVQEQHDQGIGSYALCMDTESDWRLKYIPNELIFLSKIDGRGISNVHAHLSTSLEWLTGRKIVVHIEEDGFKLFPDESEDVHGVRFVKESNLCTVAYDDAHQVCHAGAKDACIFLEVGDDFCCHKFSGSTARMALDRFARGKMNATRIGSCKLLPRENGD